MHVKITQPLIGLLIILILAGCAPERPGKHLFILSGQSNMVGLKPEESLMPTLEAEFGAGNVIVTKYAKGAQPIRRWYNDSKPMEGDQQGEQADLYDSLMSKVYPVIRNDKIETVTFIWMQGERDAREELGDVYAQSLLGLYQQLADDLDREDMNFVIGRLSDFGFTKENYPDWEQVRSAQMGVGDSHPRFGWVNTDDLNDGINREGKVIENDIHMSASGYIELGKRFANKSIQLIKKAGS